MAKGYNVFSFSSGNNYPLIHHLALAHGSNESAAHTGTASDLFRTELLH
jgi:hypothetical protein